MHERTTVHCTEQSQCDGGEHDYGRRVAGSGKEMAMLHWDVSSAKVAQGWADFKRTPEGKKYVMNALTVSRPTGAAGLSE